jgi:hypothetical protein
MNITRIFPKRVRSPFVPDSIEAAFRGSRARATFTTVVLRETLDSLSIR